MHENPEIRSPGVAGTFYPSCGRKLNKLIEGFGCEKGSLPVPEPVQGKITGGIVPHAGIEYCGKQAALFFETVKCSGFIPDTVIIVHPNHHGNGPRLSTDDHKYWEVSNGIIITDIDLAEEIGLPFSASAQWHEHSAEVIVPYIIYYMPGHVRLVSLNMLDQRHLAAEEVAGKIFKATRRLKRSVLLIASSDFSHFIPRKEATRMDQMVLDQVTSGNAAGVYNIIFENNISVCGYGPIMALMEYSSIIGSGYKVKILGRGDSGRISGSREVVSYVSAIFHT